MNTETKRTVTGGDGRQYTVLTRVDHEARPGTKARVYVRCAADDASASEVLAPFAALVGAPTPYTQRGAYPALDRAWDAFNSHLIAAKTAALRAAGTALADDVDAMMATAKFSRKAGCSCGCSPGFVVEGLKPCTHTWVEEVTQS